MTRLLAYACGEDERERYARFGPEYGFEVTCVPERPLPENACWAMGYDCVAIAAAKAVTPAMIDEYLAGGVRLLSSRAIGVDNIDLAYAKKAGLPVTRNTYSAASVADYAVMLALMVTRHTKAALLRNVGQDYNFEPFRGKELHTMTVGIVGTGNIGSVAAQRFHAFGSRVLAWSRHAHPALKGIAEYVNLDRLLRESDLISLHLTSTPATYHFLNRETIGKMKPGAYLVNTARGDLVENLALIEGLESGHLAGAALDVFEGDRGVYYLDHCNQVMGQRELAILNAMPNVIMTPHLAFWTDTAADDMVRNSLRAARQFFDGEDCPMLVK
ncbi:MAG: lactate dehydrogenase [Oscillospiraceae bacterium]|nr:lactate dehydrogenase [Oscillospiraceae bacterium]